MRTHLITFFEKWEILPLLSFRRSYGLHYLLLLPASREQEEKDGSVYALSALSGTIKTVTMFHYQFLKEKQNLFAVNVFEINYLVTIFFLV